MTWTRQPSAPREQKQVKGMWVEDGSANDGSLDFMDSPPVYRGNLRGSRTFRAARGARRRAELPQELGRARIAVARGRFQGAENHSIQLRADTGDMMRRPFAELARSVANQHHEKNDPQRIHVRGTIYLFP